MAKFHSLRTIKVGTRGSALALAQVEEIHNLLQDKEIHLNFKRVIYQTHGDKDKKTPLTANVPDDIFTDTLDQALLQKKIDIAIHSAKDLPQNLSPGLSIFVLTKSLDETDCFAGKTHFKDLKNGAKVGTSSVMRQEALKGLNPKVTIVSIRGTIEERLKLIEEGKCDGIIVATVALKRLGLKDLIKDIMPWEAVPLQGQLAVVGREDDTRLKGLFSSLDVRRFYGRVILVGAGPGDPDLITFKGIKALQKCDCVFYDYLIHPDLLKYALEAEKIYVGKRKGKDTLPQTELSRMLKEKAMEGKTVVRLKGGDPLIFGRGADEITYLRSFHVEVEVIPGVSSATAIPSKLSIPLTARGVSSSVAFLSGHGEGEREEVNRNLNIPQVDTIVFLMGLTKLNIIVKSLFKKGWDKETPIVIISKGTWPDERMVVGTLANIEKHPEIKGLEPPALIVVGEVVRLLRRPSTAAKKIFYLGTHPDKYKSLGEVIHFPMIDIQAAPMTANEKKALVKEIGSGDYLLFTSRFGVRYFFYLLFDKDFSLERLAKKKFIVIGKDTGHELEKYGFKADIIPSEENSMELLKILKKRLPLKGKRILFPRSTLPNPFLKKNLIKLGAKVKEVGVYMNSKPVKKILPEKEQIDTIVFTSPSTVRNFLKDYGTIPSFWRILAKGLLTQETLKQEGYEAKVINI